MPMYKSFMTDKERQERKDTVENALHKTHQYLVDGGMLNDPISRGLVLIEMFRSRIYVRKILYGIGTKELKNFKIEDIAEIWLEALKGLRNGKKKKFASQI